MLAISKVEKSIDELSTGNKTTDKKIIKFVLNKYDNILNPKFEQVSLFDLQKYIICSYLNSNNGIFLNLLNEHKA